MMPYAREEELLVQELPDEVLVYDLKRHRAYCLNRTAALVWQHCDGQTTVAKMAMLLENELKIPADEEVVWLALDQLRRAHLLEEPTTRPADAVSCSRRELMRKLALVGGLSVLLPAVMTIVVPTPAQAVTCVRNCAGQRDFIRCGPPQCIRVCCNEACVPARLCIGPFP